MITGNAAWTTALAAVHKQAIYVLYFPSFGIYVISYVPSKAVPPVIVP